MLRVVRTDTDALAAVDAPLGEDVRLAVADADRLGGTALETVGAPAAELRVQLDRVEIFVHVLLPLCLERANGFPSGGKLSPDACVR